MTSRHGQLNELFSGQAGRRVGRRARNRCQGSARIRRRLIGPAAARPAAARIHRERRHLGGLLQVRTARRVTRVPVRPPRLQRRPEGDLPRRALQWRVHVVPHGMPARRHRRERCKPCRCHLRRHRRRSPPMRWISTELRATSKRSAGASRVPGSSCGPSATGATSPASQRTSAQGSSTFSSLIPNRRGTDRWIRRGSPSRLRPRR